jgi:C1A family cysteine protease
MAKKSPPRRRPKTAHGNEPTPKRFGWVPDRPDQRDALYAAPPHLQPQQLPPKVDLRIPSCAPVYDQGELGSCTANAIAAALQFDRTKQGLTPAFNPSRLFIYYNERVMEGTVESDSGAMIRDGMKSVAQKGDCPEDLWPYEVAHFRDKPSAKCFKEALKYRVVLYRRLAQNLALMKGCLAEGYPFVFGFTVYESFMSDAVAKTGEVPMPQLGETGPYGEPPSGHAVMAVGYDDSIQRFIVRNSWGTGWGMQGYFTMPYQYLTRPDLSSDFWTMRIVQH